MTSIIATILIISAIGLVGGLLLSVASHYLAINEDEKTENVLRSLPGTNCGGCGYAGCLDYARAVAKGAPVNQCTIGGTAVIEKLAVIMNVKAGSATRYKAVVACQGTSDHTKNIYEYQGIPTCTACTLLYSGNLSCPFACLGFGDCVQACEFGAISIENNIAVIDNAKCTGCGNCKSACPKGIIFMYEAWSGSKPLIMCVSTRTEERTLLECRAGCTGCGKCIRYCPLGAIKIVNNVAKIDPIKCTSCGKCLGICPYDCIKTPIQTS